MGINESLSVVNAQKKMDQKTRRKSIFGGVAGNLVEWYDWFAYSMFTLYFAKSFFPAGNQTVELLQAAAVFAVGFLMRPIGAWIMGVYADRKGRKAGLTLSVTLMCGGSFLIALAPTYAQIGLLAPMILLIARLIQGLSVGGEYGASATYLTEMAGKKRRGFYSSIQYVTILSGQLLALFTLILLQNVLSNEQLHAWGWRIPFFIGGFLALTVFYIRRNMVETESFKNADTEEKSGLVALLKQYPKETIGVVLITVAGTLLFYSYTNYMQKFLVNTSGFSKETATFISTCTIFVFLCMQPIMGSLSDKIGRKKMMILFGIGGVLLTYPIFSAISVVTSPVTAGLLIIAGMIPLSCYTSISAVIKSEMFPSHIRALGVALPYALAAALFGGTAELVALKFKQMGHEQYYFIYLATMSAICLIYFIFMRDQQKHSKIIED
ncbi:MFS transporter [Acinetobacter guerrae]|uniref:MFS transporter n=1 Tax=Acinetobacter guerrae TaxID=1843371 RepID=UPI00128D56A0|nr:MFS transporter [Acinetobacter guerrae]MPW43926.1 alpha-ketoglutarate permease [Acinetobacter guerrae]